MIIFAVDDEPMLLRQLNNAITDAVPGAELYSFPHALPLLEKMQSGVIPDAAFLDIELPGMGGIELARLIKTESPKTRIVFVTGFSQYAVEAYEMHASGYIMKPVTAERVRVELDTQYILPPDESALIRAKCFGNFEVFCGGLPLRFERSKTKELLAFLIDRRGAAVNTGMLCAVLWEDEPDSIAHRNYCRKLITDLSAALAAVGAEDVFIKSRNSFAVDVRKIDCDYYRFLGREPAAVNAYTGEYMTQYSWAEQTLAGLLK